MLLKSIVPRGTVGSNPTSSAKNASVVELVDTLDLGSSANRFEGSSPSLGTRRLLLIHSPYMTTES